MRKKVKTPRKVYSLRLHPDVVAAVDLAVKSDRRLAKSRSRLIEKILAGVLKVEIPNA